MDTPQKMANRSSGLLKTLARRPERPSRSGPGEQEKVGAQVAPEKAGRGTAPALTALETTVCLQVPSPVRAVGP